MKDMKSILKAKIKIEGNKMNASFHLRGACIHFYRSV